MKIQKLDVFFLFLVILGLVMLLIACKPQETVLIISKEYTPELTINTQCPIYEKNTMQFRQCNIVYPEMYVCVYKTDLDTFRTVVSKNTYQSIVVGKKTLISEINRIIYKENRIEFINN